MLLKPVDKRDPPIADHVLDMVKWGWISTVYWGRPRLRANMR
jgi:hypothetical protein